jgi:L-ascorbate metabolism protein UlaG (beta-lactamase superfamily)
MHPFAQLSVPSGSIGIHWFEQNAYALKDSQGAILLIDPYFPTQRPPERFKRPTPPVVESELPINYVLMTHDHGDHTHPETITRIQQAWPEVRYVGPRESIERITQQSSVPPNHTTVIGSGETVSLAGITVHAFYSKPPEGDPPAGIQPPNTTHLGYVIEMGGIVIYDTGDCINTFAEHDEILGPIAALKPEIGFLTTHPSEGEFPYFEGTVKLAQKLGLKAAVPAHYECFAKRTYDPRDWAALFPAGGPPRPIIIPWNSHIVYPA